ncbi:MAG: R3H domain-containing nucleic acid-binding protein [Candidatus Paceibacterota bacterium]
MFDSKKIDIKKIKKIAQEFIRKIAPEAEVDVLDQKEGTVFIEAKVDDPQTLIGPGSETLLAIQHLLRVILRKTGGGADKPYYIDLDINNYKKKKKEYLRELAVTTANEVALAKREVSLAPMSSYERRVIHMELKERGDVATESRGFGPERKVVVKPVDQS